MIFGGQPEDGDGTITTSTEGLGELDGGERLENRIERTTEQAHLLTGDDGNGVRLREPIDRWIAGVRLAESGDQGGAAVGGKDDFPGSV